MVGMGEKYKCQHWFGRFACAALCICARERAVTTEWAFRGVQCFIYCPKERGSATVRCFQDVSQKGVFSSCFFGDSF